MVEVEYRQVAALIPYMNNSRTHDDSQVTQIAASIKEFGFTNPLLVDSDNGIIAGHGRLMAAKKLGLDEVPTILLDGLSEAQKKAYIIADNKLALNAGWDMDLLALEIEGLKELDFDIDLLGFDADELDELFPLEVDGLTDEDDVPEVPDVPISKLGDIWLLGNHKVMCGDSTSIDSVELLMDGEKADMVFTDPPYNIGFQGTMGFTSKDGERITMKDGYSAPNSQHEDIKNDKKTKEEFKVFINSALDRIKENVSGGWYICFASTTIEELLIPLVEKNMKWKSIIVWNKNQSLMGGGHFKKKYEPIAYGYFDNSFYGKQYFEEDVWDIDRTRKNDLHPTMKPILLIEKAIGYSSKKSGKVLDLFLGSGSTLIACEKTNRKCYGMELEPIYIDVIIKRWQDYTGKKAIHAETGEEFKEVSHG